MNDALDGGAQDPRSHRVATRPGSSATLRANEIAKHLTGFSDDVQRSRNNDEITSRDRVDGAVHSVADAACRLDGGQRRDRVHDLYEIGRRESAWTIRRTADDLIRGSDLERGDNLPSWFVSRSPNDKRSSTARKGFTQVFREGSSPSRVVRAVNQHPRL